MNEIGQLLREQTEIYVKNNIDRFTIIITGQPRFVGNRNWVDNVVGFYRDTKEQYPNIPMDIFFVAWSYDVVNTNWVDPNEYNIRQTGFATKEYRLKTFDPNRDENIFGKIVELRDDEKRSYGKIGAKIGEFETYMRKAFHFADSLIFCWYDPYTEYMLLDNEFSEKTGQDIWAPYGYTWQMQNFIMKRVYEGSREYFDKTVTDNTLIYKTRYDVGYPNYKWNREHNENLGNVATILHQFQYDHQVRPERPEFWKRTSHYRGVSLSPMVIIQQYPVQIIRGSIVSSDYTYGLDKQGFIDYATKYWDWAFEKYNRINVTQALFKDRAEIWGSPEVHNLKTKPEAATNAFFVDSNFTISSLHQPYLWTNNFNDYARPVVDLYRYMYQDDWDLHRFRFYHYPKDIIDELFIIDNDVVELSYYIPE